MTQLSTFISSLGKAKTHDSVTTVTVSRERFATDANALFHDFGLPLVSLYGTDDRAENKTFGVHAIFANDSEKSWVQISTEVPQDDAKYPSLTRTVMASHWYERYLCDMFGVVPEGHPDFRRLVHHENVPANTHPLQKTFKWNTKMAHANEPYPMHHVEGEGIYEIPVGPIHAGIIEPGHFRFNVAGERIITLEGKLFFTHKGVEKLTEDKTPEEALLFIERLSQDMSASHALAFCQAVESISGAKLTKHAEHLRTLLCELERITMHIHDLANIGGMGTGYSVMAAHGFRIKERLMRLSDEVFGNRFFRGMIVPGGVLRDLTKEELRKIEEVAAGCVKEMLDLTEMALSSDGFRERLETTGVLKQDVAIAYGAQGLPARASGVDRDTRRDHPYAAYGEIDVPVFVKHFGDVYARFTLRMKELEVSLKIVQETASYLTKSSTEKEAKFVLKDGEGVSAVESWRGEIITFVRIKGGKIDRCFPRDPSFCNWALFGELGPGNIVPDFPLCNKSLNLSYSGTDM